MIELNYKGRRIEVEYSWQPAEPNNGINYGYIDEISKVVWDNKDITYDVENEFKDIEKAIYEEWEKFESDR